MNAHMMELQRNLGFVGADIDGTTPPTLDDTISDAINKLMKTYVEYPPRKLQSESYSGPLTLTNYQRFQWVREQLAKDGFEMSLPTGN